MLWRVVESLWRPIPDRIPLVHHGAVVRCILFAPQRPFQQILGFETVGVQAFPFPLLKKILVLVQIAVFPFCPFLLFEALLSKEVRLDAAFVGHDHAAGAQEGSGEHPGLEDEDYEDPRLVGELDEVG